MRYYDQRILDRWKRVVDKRFKDDKRVQIIHASSMNAAMKMFDSVLHFVYLDAGHWHDDVLQDCNAWYRCVKDGWFLAGHDYSHNDFGPEIQKAVNEFAKSINKPVHSSGGDWWIQK
jgi:cephalosporin hydroxylase